jgi:hypothetical protein
MQIDYIRLSRALFRIAAHVRFIQAFGSLAFSVPNCLISESAKEKSKVCSTTLRNYGTTWGIGWNWCELAGLGYRLGELGYKLVVCPINNVTVLRRLI